MALLALVDYRDATVVEDVEQVVKCILLCIWQVEWVAWVCHQVFSKIDMRVSGVWVITPAVRRQFGCTKGRPGLRSNQLLVLGFEQP